MLIARVEIGWDKDFSFVAGGQDDDCRRGNLCSMLASIPRLFYSNFLFARHHERALHPGGVPSHLLAGDVKQHVQPHHLLLDELEVGN